MGASCCREQDEGSVLRSGDVGTVGDTPLLGGRERKVKVTKGKGEKLGLEFVEGGVHTLVVKGTHGVARTMGLGKFEGSVLTEVNGLGVKTIGDMQPFAKYTTLQLTFLSPLDEQPLVTKFPEPLQRDAPYTPPSLDTIKSYPTPPQPVPTPTKNHQQTVQERARELFLERPVRKPHARTPLLFPEIFKTLVQATQASRRCIEATLTGWHLDDMMTELMVNVVYPVGEDAAQSAVSVVQSSLPQNLPDTLSPKERLLLLFATLDGPDLDYLIGHPADGTVRNPPISLTDKRWANFTTALQSIATRHAAPHAVCHCHIPDANEKLAALWASADKSHVEWGCPITVVAGEPQSVDVGLILRFKNVKIGVDLEAGSPRGRKGEVLLPGLLPMRVESVTKIFKKSSSKFICKVDLTVADTPGFDIKGYYKTVVESLGERGPVVTSFSSEKSELAVPDFLRITAKAKPLAEGVYKLNWDVSIDGMPTWDAEVYRISSVNGRWTVGKKGVKSGQITSSEKHNKMVMPNEIKAWVRSKEGAWVADNGIKVAVTQRPVPRKKLIPQPLKRPSAVVVATTSTSSAKLFTPTTSPFDQPSTTVGPSFARPLFPTEPATEPARDYVKPEQDAFWGNV